MGVEELECILHRLGQPDPALDDTDRIDLIEVLERLKGACAGAQARLSSDYATSRTAELRSQGVSVARATRGIGAELALARRESPSRGRLHLRLARTLVGEMPATYAALCAGRITEYAAGLVVRATAELHSADRAAVDARLDPQSGTRSDAQLEAAARALTYELDPHTFVRRARKAAGDRRVTVRPAPNVMSYVTALLPVEEGVACYAALKQASDALRASGDERTSQQIAADTFVERLTGRSPAEGVDVEIQLVMTDRSLFADAATPARVPGFGPLPADLARDLARTGSTRTGEARDGPDLAGPEADLQEKARAWIRRVFLAPEDDSVRDMDSRRRTFDGRLRRLLIARDQVCRTPWCGALIRHADHVRRHADQGPTTASNGQGLCEDGNYVKELPGWVSRVAQDPDGTMAVETTTPTGHTYRSGAPPILDSMEDLGARWTATGQRGGHARGDPVSPSRDGPTAGVGPPGSGVAGAAHAYPEADLRAALEAWQRLADDYPDDVDRDDVDPAELDEDVWASSWDDDEPDLAG